MNTQILSLPICPNLTIYPTPYPLQLLSLTLPKLTKNHHPAEIEDTSILLISRRPFHCFLSILQSPIPILITITIECFTLSLNFNYSAALSIHSSSSRGHRQRVWPFMFCPLKAAVSQGSFPELPSSSAPQSTRI